MSRDETELREPRAVEGPAMISAMRQGVTEALLEHKLAGRSVVVWDAENQAIVEVMPGDIPTANAGYSAELSAPSLD